MLVSLNTNNRVVLKTSMAGQNGRLQLSLFHITTQAVDCTRSSSSTTYFVVLSLAGVCFTWSKALHKEKIIPYKRTENLKILIWERFCKFNQRFFLLSVEQFSNECRKTSGIALVLLYFAHDWSREEAPSY